MSTANTNLKDAHLAELAYPWLVALMQDKEKRLVCTHYL